MNRILFFILLLTVEFTFAQNISWWNPTESKTQVIEGQGWHGHLQNDYDRLPEKAQNEVRKPLWNLSKNSAGLKIRFRTNSTQIKIRYTVSGNRAMPHMPATGVSGVDLYAKNSNGTWLWNRGRFSFGDTITYTFNNPTPNDKFHQLGREFHLYLPLYNSFEWLEIGTENGSYFEVIPVRKEKPIVVYGTSIAQGACASRPGMAWTNILNRKLDMPIINLGFSGNGRLEPEMAKLLNELDTKVYILDCLPNLSLGRTYTKEEVFKRIVNTVELIREKTNTPILLVEHAGYGDASSNKELKKSVQLLNQTMKDAFTTLVDDGHKQLHLLTQEELGLHFEDFVDGVHPTDLGMLKYASAYEEKLRIILNRPVGDLSTQKPVTQSREPGMYNWEKRHNKLLELNNTRSPRVCFFGNSITHYWGGIPDAPRKDGNDSWQKYFSELQVQNFGFGWDRVENVLWRIYHGELDGFDAEHVVFMLGTNNLHLNSHNEIVEGIRMVLEATKDRQPKATITLLGIYPRRDKEQNIVAINQMLQKLAEEESIDFADVGIALLNNSGKVDENLFRDGLHPNNKGYNLLAPRIKELIQK